MEGETIRLIVHVPDFGKLTLKPLPPREALEIVLMARAAGARVERAPEPQTGQ
jgi:hypothetical protein